MYRLLWMLLDSMMKGGCNKSVIHGGMNNRHNSSFNRMRKKKNVADGRKKESLLGDSRDWKKLRTTHPDRIWQFSRLLMLGNPQLSSHHLLILHSNP